MGRVVIALSRIDEGWLEDKLPGLQERADMGYTIIVKPETIVFVPPAIRGYNRFREPGREGVPKPS